MKSCIRAALAYALAVSPALAQEAVPLKTLPFSPARQAGDLLFISGQIARTADGADVKESVAAETHQTMKNIGRILEEHGYAYDDLVSVTVWLSDIEDYHEMNEAYASYFKEQFPARACTGGAQIVFDFRVEIAAIAYKDAEHHHHDDEEEAHEEAEHHHHDEEEEAHEDEAHHHHDEEEEAHEDEAHHHHDEEEEAHEDEAHHHHDDEAEGHEDEAHHHHEGEAEGHEDEAHHHHDDEDEEHHHEGDEGDEHHHNGDED